MRRRAIVTVLVSLALAVGPTAVGAASAHEEATDPASGGDVDERRDEARQRRQALEEELGVLERSDAQLDADLARLAAEIEALEASTEEARRAADEVSARLVELDAEVEAAGERAEREHDRLVERAVAAYVEPGPQMAMAVVLSAEISDIGTRRLMVDVVAARDRAVLEEAVAARDDLARLEEETRRAEAEVVALRDQREADLAALEAKRAEQDLVRDALEARIESVHHEADALAAQEAELTRLIAQREQLVRATQVTAPSTTAAPTTTATSPGGPAPTSGAPSTRAPGTTPDPRPAPTPAPTSPPPTSPPTSGTAMVWPAQGYVSSVFGWRGTRMHQGIDIAAPTGRPIVAAAAGTAFYVGWMSGFGNVILVDHGNGLVTTYAHQSRFAVGQGAWVGQGQVIGYVGSTGQSTGPHLHFEVRRHGVAVDPMGYLR